MERSGTKPSGRVSPFRLYHKQKAHNIKEDDPLEVILFQFYSAVDYFLAGFAAAPFFSAWRLLLAMVASYMTGVPMKMEA